MLAASHPSSLRFAASHDAAIAMLAANGTAGHECAGSRAPPAMLAWRAAQALAIGDADPLLAVIRDHAPRRKALCASPGASRSVG